MMGAGDLDIKNEQSLGHFCSIKNDAPGHCMRCDKETNFSGVRKTQQDPPHSAEAWSLAGTTASLQPAKCPFRVHETRKLALIKGSIAITIC